MKKYKHKITGNTAVETHSEQNYRVQNFTIPKWIVENSTDWEEIEELCVPIGTKFIAPKKSTSFIYTIDSINKNNILITWTGLAGGVYYSVKDINKYFKEGVWKIWEKKEYEIVSVKLKDNTIITYNSKGECIHRTDNCSIYATVNVSETSGNIYSVKRLSDNQIFTIGDRISTKHQGSFVLEHIFLYENKIFINNGISIGFKCSLSDIFKLIPDFTTEDGVNIYEGDTAFLSFKSGSCYAAVCCKENAYFSKLCSDVKVFSTKEKCQEYIDKQKILFVTKDKVSKKTNDFCFQLCKKSGIRVQIKVDLKFYDPDNYYYIDNIDLAFAIGYAILCKNNLVNLHSHALIEANNKINNLLNERK